MKKIKIVRDLNQRSLHRAREEPVRLVELAARLAEEPEVQQVVLRVERPEA
jgi:hypothetical protein